MFQGDHDIQGLDMYCPFMSQTEQAAQRCMRYACALWVTNRRDMRYEGCALHRLSFELRGIAKKLPEAQ